MAETSIETSKEFEQISNDEESTDEEDLEVPDVIRLKPFDMEPVRKLKENELEQLGSDDSMNSDEEEKLDNERIGNNEWCVCGGKCEAMETYTESLCCQETNEIPETYFQGKSFYIILY